MKYKDLNLAKIRDDNSLDFAHYTFLRGQCSCCYGPKDLPSKYWRNNVIAEESNNTYSYLLFNNAENGKGCVKASDDIREYQAIFWRFPEEKLYSVCESLQEQFGDKYAVLIPKTKNYCIVIASKQSMRLQQELNSGNFTCFQELKTN